MRVLVAVLLMLFATGAARADYDAGCSAMKELLGWTADALQAARDGKPANGRYIVDSVAFTADQTIEALWPVETLDILGELGMLAIAIAERDGEVMPGDAEGMLGYADALAAITTERCGEGWVPTFVRPGLGDPRACPQVIETLEAIGKAMPAIAGKESPMMVLVVATAGAKAVGHATASQWSARAITALSDIETGARLLSRGETPNGPNAAQRMRDLAATVAAEAKSICVDTGQIPMLAEAGT
jgi:hypothetical protein